ncbi:MAG: hypothetical protein ACI92G_002456 [Candidatus Pelagisphaera sp.]|jgi:hypothetical protein
MKLSASQFVDSCDISSPDSRLFVGAEFIEGRVYGVDPFSVIGSEEADGLST